MKAILTKRRVDAVQPGPNKIIVWDTKLTGFALKVEPSGVKTFMYAYRFPRGRAGRMRYYTIGRYGDFTADEARDAAEILQGEYKRGGDPMARLEAERHEAETKRKAPKKSVEHIVEEFVERYAKKNNRSWSETERILKRHATPAWGKRQIGEVTRSDVNALLDEIEDKSGAPMATAVLAQVRKMFNWHATRDEAFNSPIVKGMARTSPAKLKRDRFLSDDEIRVLWQALNVSKPPFKQLVRTLLLTAQRREEVARARLSEIDGDIWTIPAERYKNGRANIVPLSKLAVSHIAELDDTGDGEDERPPRGDFIFSTRHGQTPFSGFGKAKRELDEEMERLLRKSRGITQVKKGEKLLKPWRLHDLRRTAKTLMQRAGVRPDISERVLGHVIPGVEGTYDRHAYVPEKRHALEMLSAEIERILKYKPEQNVVTLHTARAR